MELTENLYCYIWKGRGNNAHSYLFRGVLPGERPHVIVDPGYRVNETGEKCYENLVALMRQDGIEPEEIGLIVDTHSHADHCGASEVIAGAGSEGAADRRGLITLSKQEDEYRRATGRDLHKMIGLPMEEFEPDFYLQEGSLVLGNGGGRFELEIIYTPGHCPGSISVYDPQNRALITGDAVFNRSVGRTDFPGGDGNALKASIEKLARFEAEYLLPGHSTEYGNIIIGKDQVEQNFEFIRKYFFPLI
ncbi:MAG: MBL fold metallo-hydrolase [Dehalococcoidia bacterium]